MNAAATRQFYLERLRAVLSQLKMIFNATTVSQMESLKMVQDQIEISEMVMDKSNKVLQKQLKQWSKANEKVLEKILQIRDLYRKLILFVMYLQKNVKSLVNSEFREDLLPGLNSYIENLELYLIQRQTNNNEDDITVLKSLCEPDIFAKGYLAIAAKLKKKLVGDVGAVWKSMTPAFQMGKKVATQTGKRVKKAAGVVGKKALEGAVYTGGHVKKAVGVVGKKALETAVQTGKRIKRKADDLLAEAVMGPAAKNPRLIWGGDM